MANIAKVVSVVDAVCNCTPILSTIACSAQLLYLAYRVNGVTHPPQGIATEIKLHVVNKSSFELVMGVIPLIGNLYHFATLVINGFRDQLRTAICSCKLEAVQLCLANRYLENSDYKPLWFATKYSNPEILGSILDSREWTEHDLVTELRELPNLSPNDALKVTQIIEYCEQKFGPVLKDASELIFDNIQSIEKFRKAGKIEFADRLIAMLPKTNQPRDITLYYKSGEGSINPEEYMLSKYTLLRLAVRYAKLEVFGLTLKSRNWTQPQLIYALSVVDNLSQDDEMKAIQILDYYCERFRDFNGSEKFMSGIFLCIENFIKAGKTDFANRLIAMLPDKIWWMYLQLLIKDYSFDYDLYSVDAVRPGVLTRENINTLLDRCEYISLDDIVTYCGLISDKKDKLKEKLAQAGNGEEILKASDEVQSHIVSRLIKKFDREKQVRHRDEKNALALLAIKGKVYWLELFLAHYETNLTHCDKWEILEKIWQSKDGSEEQQLKKKEGFRFLFERFKSVISDENIRSMHEEISSIETQAGLNSSDPVLNHRLAPIILEICPEVIKETTST